MTIFLETVVLGTIVGIFSSAMFLLLLSRYKPKVEISPYIAVKRKSDGNLSYRIKVINRTPRDIINIRAEFSIVNFSNTPGGVISNNTSLSLKKSEVFHISRYDKKDVNANYAFRFVCLDDLDSVWSDNNGKYVKFKLIATDSFTGFSKVFVKDFHVKHEVLVEGSHKFGDSLDVV